jgi:Flp pilus assembly protein TadD
MRVSTSVLCLLLGLGACANDPNTASAVSGETAQSSDPEKPSANAQAILRVATATAERGDWPMAISLFRRAQSMDPTNFNASYSLARALTRVGAHEDALKAYRTALKQRPKDPNVLRGIGNSLIMLERSAQAVPYFERALANNNDPRLYNGIGVAHDMLDDFKAAQAWYRTGLKTSETNLALRNNLGLSLLFSRHFDEAIRELRQVVADPGATRRHRLNLALALVLAQESEAAESIARIDLPADEAREQIAYFETIAGISDPRAARDAIRMHLRGTP